MKDKIILETVQCKHNKISVYFNIEGTIKKYFNTNYMYVEYEDVNVEEIPEGIAVIPILSNLLPIAWFSNAEIIVNKLDKTFYNAIDKIKTGYINMHINAKLQGIITVKNICEYSYIPTKKSATFFSGGVDSLATLITRIDERPTLITVWGSDIKTNNESGWIKVKNEVTNFGKEKDLKNLLVKSNFREFINEQELNKSFSKSMGDNWWHGAQHGIGLIGLAVPFGYLEKLNVIYIPSTFTEKDGHISCASYPTIDNNFSFANCKVLHEGFENSRQDKIGVISDYIKNIDSNLFIRVCWRSTNGKNCGVCEKCSRTIMALIACGVNPNTVGFSIDESTLKNIEINFKENWVNPDYVLSLWLDIQNAYRDNLCNLNFPDEVGWVLNYDFEKEHIKKKQFKSRIIRKIKTILIRG